MEPNYYQIFKIEDDSRLVPVVNTLQGGALYCQKKEDILKYIKAHGVHWGSYTALPVYICQKISKIQEVHS